MKTKKVPNDVNSKGERETVLIKLSGEAFGNDRDIFFAANLQKFAAQIQELHKHANVAVVVGGGNIFRGKEAKSVGIDPVTADHMGMMATMINGSALESSLKALSLNVRVMSAKPFPDTGEVYIYKKAMDHLLKGRVLIFTGGTGNPHCTTDFAAGVRAADIGASQILKATNVDGVYDQDPNKNPKAKLYHSLSFEVAIRKNLGVMDVIAFQLCAEKQIPITVFNANASFVSAWKGEIGTHVHV